MAYIPFSGVDPMDAMHNYFRQVGPTMSMGFPVGIPPMMGAMQAQARAGCYRPGQRGPGRQNYYDEVGMHSDGDTYRISVDVKDFSPEEISVKVVDNGVVVEGKHHEKEENVNEYVSRHLVRRYVIPENVRSEAISSSLSSDGILTITAPKVHSMQEEAGRPIPITITGLPAKQSTSSDSSSAKNEEKTKE